MDVTFDEVSAEVQKDEPVAAPAPQGAQHQSQPSLNEREHDEYWRAARAERLRARLHAF